MPPEEMWKGDTSLEQIWNYYTGELKTVPNNYKYITVLSLAGYAKEYGSAHSEQAFAIYDISKKWGRSQIDSISELHEITELLVQDTANYEKFLKLDPYIQKIIGENASVFNAKTLDLYLRAMEISGYPKVPMIQLTLKNVQQFDAEVTTNTGVEHSTSRLFQDVTLALIEKQRRGYPLLTVLYLLKIVYSEQTILEILERFDDEGVNWGHYDIVEIAERWSQVSTYPIAWIENLVERTVSV